MCGIHCVVDIRGTASWQPSDQFTSRGVYGVEGVAIARGPTISPDENLQVWNICR
jgi:hypothetical protein